uniref:Ion_trans domain-containing protein n=1 Tax=Steinernema glaseri TaxID=37863 RepID=A0A1I7YWK1_9BILA
MTSRATSTSLLFPSSSNELAARTSSTRSPSSRASSPLLYSPANSNQPPPSALNSERRVFFRDDPKGSDVERIDLSPDEIGSSAGDQRQPFFTCRTQTPEPSPHRPNAANSSGRKMSLVGKPLTYKHYRTDQRFRRVQSKMHNFLERPRGWKAAGYHLCVLVMVLTCLALSVFSTMPDYEEQATVILYYIEIVFVFWLAIEYVCRVWSAGCRSRYRGITGRFRFATSAYCVIDIIVILASVTVLCIGATGQVSHSRSMVFCACALLIEDSVRTGGGDWVIERTTELPWVIRNFLYQKIPRYVLSAPHRTLIPAAF